MQFPPDYDWVFFDLDGTLWDHPAAMRQALTHLCGETGLIYEELAPLFREANEQLWVELAQGHIDMRTLRVRRFRHVLDRAFQAAHGLDPEVLSRLYLERYLAYSGELAGASAALDAAAAVARVAILTNAPHETQDKKVADVASCGKVAWIFCTDDCTAYKPDSAFYGAAEQLAGNPAPERVLCVGDSWEHDIRPAQARGWWCVWLGGELDPPEQLDRVVALRHIREFAPWLVSLRDGAAVSTTSPG